MAPKRIPRARCRTCNKVVNRARGIFCNRTCEGLNRRVPAKERFWLYVNPCGSNDCWEWQGGRSSWGYGVIGVNGKSITASRFSYELHYGSIPSGGQVLHRCDNPSCVNPQHLFIGSQAENVADMIAKGRDRTLKLTSEDLRQIRTLHSEQVAQAQIAARFLISVGTVNNIIHRRGCWNDTV